MYQVIATIKSIMGLAIATIKFIMGWVIAVIKLIMGQVITAIKSIIMSPGLCDTSITWVPIGRPPSPPATVKNKDEGYGVVYLPGECGLCLDYRK